MFDGASGQERLGDLAGSLLVGEQAGASDDPQVGVREGGDHPRRFSRRGRTGPGRPRRAGLGRRSGGASQPVRRRGGDRSCAAGGRRRRGAAVNGEEVGGRTRRTRRRAATSRRTRRRARAGCDATRVARRSMAGGPGPNPGEVPCRERHPVAIHRAFDEADTSSMTGVDEPGARAALRRDRRPPPSNRSTTSGVRPQPDVPKR